MKFLKKLIAGAIALGAAVLAFSARANIVENAQGYNAWGGTGTTQGTTNAYYVVGNQTLSLGTPIVRNLNVSSDLATSKVQFYVLTNQVTITNVLSGTTNLSCTSTNGYTVGAIMVIKHNATDTYERLPINIVQTNSIIPKYPPLQTPVIGDTVWYAQPSGFFNIGAASNSVPTGAGQFLWAGQYNKPLLIEINGTSWAQINAVSGDFRP